MGLDTTHDAFHGAYGAFNRFRQEVCWAIGGSFPPHFMRDKNGSVLTDEHALIRINKELDGNFIYFPEEGVEEGMYEFLTHSDCDGEISPEMCLKVADDLERILPKIQSLPDQGGGHIARRGGFAEVTKKFIAGCREAAANNEPLRFM